MKKRLIRSTCVVTLLPLLTILLSYRLWGNQQLQLAVLLLGTLAQAAAVTWYRNRLAELACPSDEVLSSLNIRPVAAIYQPGRFKTDLSIHRRAMYLGVPAPLLAFLARVMPFWAASPEQAKTYSFYLAFGAVLFSVAGAVCLAFWARLLQAEAIADAVGERRRYLLRGFAALVDRPDFMPEYNAVTARFPAARKFI